MTDFEKYFNALNDAVFICRVAKNQLFEQFVDVNNKACDQLIFSKQDLLRLALYDIIDPNDSEIIKQSLNDLAEKDHHIFELTLRTSDKRRVPVEVSASLLELNKTNVIIFVTRDITERKRSETRLLSSHEQFRNLASHIQSIREEERSLLAREIHDELGQALTVMKIQISLLSNKLRKDQADLKTKANSITDVIDQTVDSLQRILAKLRPGILDELGLVPAIEWQAQDFQKVTGIVCDCMLPEDSLDLDTEKSTAIFRIFQEALTNIARHSNASHLSVILKTENQQLILEVTDNGIGISKSQIYASNSFGLLGMKERTMLVGGKFQINGVRDQGTNVKVEIPLLNSDQGPGISLIEH